MEIQFERLGEPLNPAYLGMTYAEHRPSLAALGQSPEIIAIGATAGVEPVGLGLAQVDQATAEGTVLSLFIIPALQRRGLGTALLEALEIVLARIGCQRGKLFYNTELPSAAAVERVLQKADWSPPRRYMLTARVLDQTGGESLRSFADVQLAPGFSVFPWTELTLQERAGLEQVRASIPDSVWPFHDENAPLEPAISIGLRYGDEVAGWFVAHRVAPTLVRYTSLYVRESWRNTKVLPALLMEIGRRQREFLGPDVQPTLGVLADNEPMIRLVERRFRAFCLPFQEIRVAEKVLTLR